MKPLLVPSTQKQALICALKPYKHYTDWIKSKDCFLSKEEIGLISLYLQTGSYAVCCGLLQKSIIEVANLLIKTILRLKAWLFLYQQWEQRQAYLDKLRSQYHRHIKRQLRQSRRWQGARTGAPP